VTLRLDGEEPGWANHHVIDVAATCVDVVQREPAIPQGLEQAADLLLPTRAASPALHDGDSKAIDREQRGNHHELRRSEPQAHEAERGECKPPATSNAAT
jgi:hypothetical protein